MENQNFHQGKKNRKSGILGYAIAVAIGAAIGVLFAPKSGNKTRQEMKDRALSLADKFNKSRKEIQKTVQDIFGEVSEELERNYIEVRGNLIAVVDEVKDKAALTQRKYNQIVNDTVDRLTEGKEFTKDSIERLKKSLQDEYNDMMEKYRKD